MQILLLHDDTYLLLYQYHTFLSCLENPPACIYPIRVNVSTGVTSPVCEPFFSHFIHNCPHNPRHLQGCRRLSIPTRYWRKRMISKRHSIASLPPARFYLAHMTLTSQTPEQKAQFEAEAQGFMELFSLFIEKKKSSIEWEKIKPPHKDMVVPHSQLPDCLPGTEQVRYRPTLGHLPCK